MPTISILTYNILSQNLAELMLSEVKDGKEVYKPSVMNESNRWQQISNIILSHIINSNKQLELDNLVICLQEVTEEWVPRFAELFSSVNYSYINIQHGRVFNGNMGVLIAWPKTLNIVKSEFYTVGQHIIVTDDNSKLSASKSNIAILLLLENPSINFKFGVVTYHMPLEPKIPHISMSHAKVLMKKILKFMALDTYFFAGDFNITPDTRTYNYLSSVNNCIWSTFFNAYPITNHAHIKGYEFSGCLDYIFYSNNGNIKCDDVKVEKVNGIMPNNDHPSDHIPIYAKFRLI